MTLKEFRNEFSKIPEDRVISGVFTNGIDSCSVIGHFIRLTSGDIDDYSTSNTKDYGGESNGGVLRKVAHNYLKRKFRENPNHYCRTSIASICNEKTYLYPQETPKKRSLALLDDMIADGWELSDKYFGPDPSVEEYGHAICRSYGRPTDFLWEEVERGYFKDDED